MLAAARDLSTFIETDDTWVCMRGELHGKLRFLCGHLDKLWSGAGKEFIAFDNFTKLASDEQKATLSKYMVQLEDPAKELSAHLKLIKTMHAVRTGRQ